MLRQLLDQNKQTIEVANQVLEEVLSIATLELPIKKTLTNLRIVLLSQALINHKHAISDSIEANDDTTEPERA